jgi:hypothetical protein
MTGSAQADKVYVWNYDPDPSEETKHQSFTLAQNARLGGLVLAYSRDNNSVLTLDGITGTDRIAVIDLEGHLTDGKLSGSANGDWLTKKLVICNNTTLSGLIYLNRLTLGTFVGASDTSLSASYQIKPHGTDDYGTLELK